MVCLSEDGSCCMSRIFFLSLRQILLIIRKKNVFCVCAFSFSKCSITIRTFYFLGVRTNFRFFFFYRVYINDLFSDVRSCNLWKAIFFIVLHARHFFRMSQKESLGIFFSSAICVLNTFVFSCSSKEGRESRRLTMSAFVRRLIRASQFMQK